MKKAYLTLFMLTLMLCSLVLVGTIHLGKAQSGTSVNGIIYSNTTWTPSGSPYTFTGPVAINAGVTLTIQAGVTVNINTNSLQVNGTINVQGAAANPIYLDGGQITFTGSSSSWNGQTDSGCVIENAFLNSAVNIQNASPMISYDSITGGISVSGGSPIISNNVIKDLAVGISTYESTTLDSATISNNYITGCETGIQLFSFGTSIVEGNLIMNSSNGIQFFTLFNGGSGVPTVQENTITNNSNGISFNIIGAYSVAPIIINNNIFANNYNIYSSVANNINAADNWWGTTDTQAINQTLYDFKDDFNLGNITFVPFLTSPNTQAPTYINATAGSGGSISPNGFISTNYGGSQSFTITPSSGYQIANVLVNGSSVGAVSAYNIQNVNGATTISATFTPNPTPTPPPTATPTSAPTQTPTSNPTSSPTPKPTSTTSPNNNNSNSQSPSPTPHVPEFPTLLAIATLMITVTLSMAVLAAIRKRKSER